MENTTKALMIAAAVLVVMLIIGLGIGIFNMAAEQVDANDSLTEQQIQKHNAKFLKHEGSNVSREEVNAMITTVFNHNLAQPDDTTCVGVILDEGDNYTAVEKTNSSSRTPIQASLPNKYIVFCELDKDSKLVDIIVVKAITWSN